MSSFLIILRRKKGYLDLMDFTKNDSFFAFREFAKNNTPVPFILEIIKTYTVAKNKKPFKSKCS